MGPTGLLSLRRKACWGLFRPKSPTASAGCEPANLGTKGQNATSRNPKPFIFRVSRGVEQKRSQTRRQNMWTYIYKHAVIVTTRLQYLYPRVLPTISSLWRAPSPHTYVCCSSWNPNEKSLTPSVWHTQGKVKGASNL